MRRPAAARRTAAAGAVAGVLAVLAAPAGAHAAGYRYWSFWERSGGGWSYASAGPAGTEPADGSVEGWRFGVSPDSPAGPRPRGAVTFAAVCGGVPAAAGRKRVALVVDFGTAADAPAGARPPAERTACAALPPDGTAADALAAVARPLRYAGSGLLCAVTGYPATGCGEQVTGHGTPSPASHNAAGGGGSPSPTGVYAGMGAVAVLAGAALVRARRRRAG